MLCARKRCSHVERAHVASITLAPGSKRACTRARARGPFPADVSPPRCDSPPNASRRRRRREESPSLGSRDSFRTTKRVKGRFAVVRYLVCNYERARREIASSDARCTPLLEQILALAYTRTRTCTHAYIHIPYVRTCIQTYLHKYIYTYIHTYLPTYKYLHTHMHTYLHTHLSKT